MIDLLLDALATYRLTRLVTADTILDAPREAIVEAAYEQAGRIELRHSAHFGVPWPFVDDRPANRLDPTWWADLAHADPRAPKLAELVTCRWCAGMWIAVGVVAARRLAPRTWGTVARGLAFSAGAALAARIEDD